MGASNSSQDITRYLYPRSPGAASVPNDFRPSSPSIVITNPSGSQSLAVGVNDSGGLLTLQDALGMPVEDADGDPVEGSDDVPVEDAEGVPVGLTPQNTPCDPAGLTPLSRPSGNVGLTLPTIPPFIGRTRPRTSFVGTTPQNTPCVGPTSQTTPVFSPSELQLVPGGEPEPERTESWRQGDDAALVREPDYQVTPSPSRPHNESNPTTLATSKFRKLKRKCKNFFNLSEQNHPGSPHHLSGTEHTKRTKRRMEPENYSVRDIIKRKQRLTGRSLTVGTSEVRILPEATRAKLLYYLMAVGEDLQIIINDLGKGTVDSYPEYQDDLIIMRWLIRAQHYPHFAFSVDNLCCRECVSGWRMKVREYQ
jgi:hypothetical protein